jgi:signal transduction histidine kinase
MSGRRTARTRLIAASILAIVAALATFVVIITVRYRDGLEQRLRTDLTSGASALRAARRPQALKPVIASLAAEGISVDLAGTTGKRGSLRTAPGGTLLTVQERIPVGGKDVRATLTGSRAGIDRQVRSLEVTEAIGGVIALALLAALARALVLLDRAASDARASEAAMRTFLADASHELRTPVAALQATAERLLRDQPPRPARDAIEAQLARDSGRLGHLTDDLLNLARLDARERPHRELVDLADLASAAVAATRTADPAAHVDLVTNGPVPASGDRDALLRAVRNLLDNAVAAADTVEVAVTRTANAPTMSVTDNGPGVPADQRERIFEPFVRLPGSPRGGTGLGLAIVRRTIQSQGGTITCDPSPTGGARFTLRLPADPQTGARPQEDPHRAKPTRRPIAAAKALADRLTPARQQAPRRNPR